MTADQDCNQLYKYPNYRQIKPIDKTEFKDIDAARVLQMKILTGDSGDNIKNLRPRLGEKNAIKIIQEYNGNIYEFARKENLMEAYMINQRLINFDLIPIEIKDYVWKFFEARQVGSVNHVKMMETFGPDYELVTRLSTSKLLSNAPVKNFGWN